MSAPEINLEPMVVSVREAARLLRIGYSTAQLHIADGSIRSVKIGRRRLVPRAEIARLVAGDVA